MVPPAGNGRGVLRDLTFARHPGFRPLTLDLHRPDTEEPVPVIVQLHGGGWRAGSRAVFTAGTSDAQTFELITAQGFAVVAADYRLSAEATFPAQLDDVDAVIDWLGAHGAEYGLDPDRIVLWGVSAGATLASLAGLRPRDGVRGVIDWFGPSDLFAMAKHTEAVEAPGESREDQWLGAPVGSVPQLARAASPALVAAAGAVPFHIAHGLADDLVPPAQSQALADALSAAGVDVELHLEPGAGHFWKDAADLGALFDRAIAFARRVTGSGADALAG